MPLTLLLPHLQSDPARTHGGSLGTVFARPSPSWQVGSAGAERGEDVWYELLPAKLVRAADVGTR